MAGSFDPVSVGHLDIIKRAASLVDKLDIAVSRNYSKSGLFTFEERCAMLEACTKSLENVSVIAVDGLLTDQIEKDGYKAYFRGLRSTKDFEYELELSQIYGHFLKDKCEVIYLMTDPAYSYISSSTIRENYLLGADVSEWVPEEAYKLMIGDFNKLKGETR